jgi:uncharacterized alkaline shock family protein YloU
VAGAGADAQISPDVLARYAADAASEVKGVGRLLGDRMRRHGGVRVKTVDGGVALEVHLAAASGVALPALGRNVQRHVADYLERMTGSAPTSVDVFVHEIGS